MTHISVGVLRAGCLVGIVMQLHNQLQLWNLIQLESHPESQGILITSFFVNWL